MSLLPLYRLALLARVWIEDVPEGIREELLSRGRRLTLAKGQRLSSRDDKSNGIFCVLEGCVRLSVVSQDGRETVLDLYGPGTWFGEVSAFDGLRRGHDAIAYESTSVLHVAQADLEYLLKAHPELSRAFLRLEALRLRLVLTALQSYSVQSLVQRLADRLLMLSASYGVVSPHGLRINLHLPQETLGELIGATRQRVNQILTDWERDGVVEQRYGHIVLLDVSKLEQLAQM